MRTNLGSPAGEVADAWANTKRDKIFQALFSKMLVYTILLEDCEVDDEYFGVQVDSSVLTIAGAGCGAAGLLAHRPERIDVVDSNRHHLAITCLKMTAAVHMPSYTTFYDLLGRGWTPFPQRDLAHLEPHMPHWAIRYWRRNRRMLRTSLYNHGLMARSFATIRRALSTDESWMRKILEESQDFRNGVVDRDFVPVFTRRIHAAAVRSPLLLLSQGVNYVQRERNLAAHGTRDMLEVTLEFLRRIAATDLENNWIAWNATVGHFNHERSSAVPPYLRESHYLRSFASPTQVDFHHGNIFEKLENAGAETWSHFNVSDTIDWMPEAVQRKLFEEIRRCARPGATLLLRSVEPGCLMERRGLSHQFERIEPASTEGSKKERSKLYQWTGFYRVK